MSPQTSNKKSSNSVSDNLLKTPEPKPSNETENHSGEVEGLKSGESLVKIFNFLPPANPAELKKLKGFWEAMKAVNVKPQRGAPLPVPEVSKKAPQEKVLSKHGSADVRKEPIVGHVGSFQYQEIVRLNEWKGQQQRDREKREALRAILPPPCCCKTCGLRPVDCACPAEVPEVLSPPTIPSPADLLTCHSDCVCDENDDLESEQGCENHSAVNNLEQQQCDCNTETTPNNEATSVKEECDCSPFCSCIHVESSVDSDNANCADLNQTVDSNNFCKKFCECSTICYCEKEGSSCLCCLCNRIGSALADPNKDSISSGMKQSQCGCESLCECEYTDCFSVDYMKELGDLRQKTDDVYESSCKLEELKETFRESVTLPEPFDFFRRLKPDEQVGGVEEKSSFDRFVEETLVKYGLPACECSHSDCDCRDRSVEKVDADESCDCEVSSTCKCQEDPVFKKPAVVDRACGRHSEIATLASKALMCFVCGHFGCGCQDDESDSNIRRKLYVQDFDRQRGMSWKGDYEGLDACFIEVSEIVDAGEIVKPSGNGEQAVQVARISVGCNTTEGQDKCL